MSLKPFLKQFVLKENDGNKYTQSMSVWQKIREKVAIELHFIAFQSKSLSGFAYPLRLTLMLPLLPRSISMIYSFIYYQNAAAFSLSFFVVAHF